MNTRSKIVGGVGGLGGWLPQLTRLQYILVIETLKFKILNILFGVKKERRKTS